MLVQTVAKQFGEAYCQGCQQLRTCIAVTLRCEERNTIVNHLFSADCIGRGIGVEVKLPDPQVGAQLARRRRLSRRGERATAREVEGQLTPASGALRGDGDVVTKDWMIEEKSTANRSYRLSVNVLKKAMAQAANHGRDWLIRIRMPDGFDLAVLDWRVLRGWVRNGDSARADG